jgi:hypothetical protein
MAQKKLIIREYTFIIDLSYLFKEFKMSLQGKTSQPLPISDNIETGSFDIVFDILSGRHSKEPLKRWVNHYVNPGKD